MTREPIRVFWQPGCSSCLAAKEFLTAREVPFESINVRAAPGAMAELAALGVRTVPVVSRGQEFVLAQDLDELARFVGVVFERDRLSPDALVARLLQLLGAAQRLVEKLPAASLTTPLRGRNDRTWLSLAYHVAVIPEAFLDAAEGGVLSYDYYERLPPEDVASIAAVGACYRAIRERIENWWQSRADALPATVNTYYGTQDTITVLERTTWHVAQHTRQLESLVRQATGTSPSILGEVELGGLPLPANVWDDEVVMDS